MKKKTPKPSPFYQEVQLFDPKPNSMFPEWMTERLRFLRYFKAVACAECGKKSKHMWTMLVQFKAHDLGTGMTFVMPDSGKQPAPLTAVCRAHPLNPMMPNEEKEKTNEVPVVQ